MMPFTFDEDSYWSEKEYDRWESGSPKPETPAKGNGAAGLQTGAE